jgi:hypothetical protein
MNSRARDTRVTMPEGAAIVSITFCPEPDIGRARPAAERLAEERG